MTQCAVIGLVDENWEPKNYIEFSEYRKDIKKLEDENRKLKDIEAELLKEKKELLDKVETLELWLDMKEKLNEEYRKEIDRLQNLLSDVNSCSESYRGKMLMIYEELGKFVMKS